MEAKQAPRFVQPLSVSLFGPFLVAAADGAVSRRKSAGDRVRGWRLHRRREPSALGLQTRVRASLLSRHRAGPRDFGQSPRCASASVICMDGPGPPRRRIPPDMRQRHEEHGDQYCREDDGFRASPDWQLLRRVRLDAENEGAPPGGCGLQPRVGGATRFVPQRQSHQVV